MSKPINGWDYNLTDGHKAYSSFPKREHCVKEGMFRGATSTNAIEGGNWRIKHELRTTYVKYDSIFGRILQLGLHESLKTFSSELLRNLLVLGTVISLTKM